MAELLIGGVVVAFIGVLAFGLLTRRIAWRQEACCAPADPARDLRTRDSSPTDSITTDPTTTTSRRPAP
jgi:hypothetical protein